jgi:hypothetical protein
MVQILQGPRNIGDVLGTGLSDVLNQLADNKLRQVHQRNMAQGLQSALQGISPEQAQGLAGLGEGALEKILPELFRAQREREFQQGFQTGEVAEAESLGGPAETRKSLIQQAIDQGYQPPRNSKEANDIIKQMHQANIEKEKLSSKEKSSAFKETKAEREKIIQDYNVAKNNLEDYDRLQELEDEGKLDTPGYIEFLKRSGLDIAALKNPGSEEAQKIVQNFIRDAKQVYGGKITNQEMEQFMSTLPSLSQSPEGRKRVIANLKRIARAKVEYYKAYKRVLKQNKGVPPLDLLEQVQEEYEPAIEKLASQFRKDLERPVPEGQNKFVTALQAGAGEVAGALPKALSKAISHGAIGAAAGSAFPGLGTAVGGGLGALYGLFKD